MLLDDYFVEQMKADLKDYTIMDVKKDSEPFMKMDLYVNKTKKRFR